MRQLENKFSIFFIGAFLFSMVTFSCNSANEGENKEDPTESSTESTETTDSKCRIKKLSKFNADGSLSEYTMSYENGRCTKLQYALPSRGILKSFNYYYREGQRTSLAMPNDTSDAIYFSYDDQNRIVGWEEKKGRAIKIYYNDLGQIEKQEFINKGKAVRTMNFKYGENGKLLKTRNEDAYGREVTVFIFEFDDQKNPIKGLEYPSNVLGKHYGFPVGQMDNNLRKVTISYVREAERPDEHIDFVYSYNELGYATGFHFFRNDRKTEIQYLLECL